MMLTVGLSYVAFITLRCVPSSPTLFKTFILKACQIFDKGLSAFSKDDQMVFGFKSTFIIYIIY